MKEATRKGLGRNVSTKTYPEIDRGLEDQLPRLKRIVRRTGHRSEQGHVLDAMLAYLLTRSEEEQMHVLCEGRRIVMTLEKGGRGMLAPLMPGTYSTMQGQGGNGRQDQTRGGSYAVLTHGVDVPDGVDASDGTDVGGGECDDQSMSRRQCMRPRK